LAKKHGAFLQLVDPAVVYNQRHLESAHFHATRALAEKREKSNGWGSEFLLYVTGQRQVSRALDLGGIKAGNESTVLVADGDRSGTVVWGLLDKLGWSRDSQGIPVNPRALEALGIAEPRDGNVESAVLEKVALVDVLK
jgi:KEOPS complex subunit Cgi121